MAASASKTSSICRRRMSTAARRAKSCPTVIRTRRMARRCAAIGRPCPRCPLKSQCTKGPERRVTRWEHEHVLEAVQQRLDENPQAMRVRRETAEHPFGTLKMRMGAAHFLMKRLPKVATEMALHVFAYNLTRVMNIMGIQPLMAAIRA